MVQINCKHPVKFKNKGISPNLYGSCKNVSRQAKGDFRSSDSKGTEYSRREYPASCDSTNDVRPWPTLSIVNRWRLFTNKQRSLSIMKYVLMSERCKQKMKFQPIIFNSVKLWINYCEISCVKKKNISNVKKKKSHVKYVARVRVRDYLKSKVCFMLCLVRQLLFSLDLWLKFLFNGGRMLDTRLMV